VDGDAEVTGRLIVQAENGQRPQEKAGRGQPQQEPQPDRDGRLPALLDQRAAAPDEKREEIFAVGEDQRRAERVRRQATIMPASTRPRLQPPAPGQRQISATARRRRRRRTVPVENSIMPGA